MADPGSRRARREAERAAERAAEREAEAARRDDVGGKDLTTGGHRPSFLDMDPEATDLGWTSGEQKPSPGRGGSFPSLGGSRSNSPPPAPRSFRPAPRRRRPGRLPLIAAVLAALLVVGGVAYAVGSGDDEQSAPAPASAATSTPAEATATSVAGDDGTVSAAASTDGAEKKVKLGVFRGTTPSGVGEFSDWLGRDVDYAMDYSTRATWDEIANPTYMLSTWQGSGYTMVYAVAMLPTGSGSSATMAAGADGDYNQYYKTLAQNLVDYGQGDSIIRLGWEFNVTGWPWHPTNTKDFVAYWREIVTTMRAVPGAEKLEFDWNVNNGGDTYDSTVYYPGSKYVDYIGVDVYDISWEDGTYPYPSGCKAACRLQRQTEAWDNVLNANYGLLFWSDFAEAQKKPMSLPEWGAWDRSVTDGHGGADNPYFIEQMHDFIDNPLNNVAYQAYFDFDTETKGDHSLENLTKSGKEFKKLFG